MRTKILMFSIMALLFSSEVFEHVFNLPDILKELNRILKVNGVMLLTCPFSFCEHEIPNDFARYSSFGIKYLLNQSGFEIIRLTKTGNSIETISQLLLVYIHQHISPWFRKIPVLRSGFKLIMYTSLNVIALALSPILPAGKDLYMNNVVLCKKIKNM
jgi:ubiquinone/menaquinone biosynthesis C-methylase UbiE